MRKVSHRCGGNEIGQIDNCCGISAADIELRTIEGLPRLLFIATGEAGNGDGAIPFLALGQVVEAGYKNEIRYTHSSLLRTLEEIFGVHPLLGGAAYARDLRDLFSAYP